MPVSDLIANNRAWAAETTRRDPQFFARLAGRPSVDDALARRRRKAQP